MTARGNGRSAVPSLYRLGEATPSGPREYAVGGLIECASSVLLIGAPKGGKTAIAVHLAFCIALGRPFLGRRVRRGAVVYVATERFRETDLRLQTQFGSDASTPPIRITQIRDLFSNAEAAAGLVEAANAFERECGVSLGLIVIDTLSAVIGDGDENSARDVNRMGRHLDMIREGTNAVVLVIHHAKRGEARSRGSEALEAFSDLTLAVEEQKGGRQLRVTRSNSIPEGITIPFELKAEPLGTDDATGESSSVVLAGPVDDHEIGAGSAVAPAAPSLNQRARDVRDLVHEIGNGTPVLRADLLDLARQRSIVNGKTLAASAEQLRKSLCALQDAGDIDFDSTQVRPRPTNHDVTLNGHSA